MREFGYLNRKIREHIVDIKENFDISIDEYLELMRKIYKISDKIMFQAANHVSFYRDNIDCVPYKRGISLEDTIKIVKKFLTSIDVELCSLFEYVIENEIILFHDKKELKKLQISKDNFFFFYNLTGIHNGNKLINIVLTNTIVDVFAIVHEFIHYVSMNSLNQKSITWLHFTEGYSHTFEQLLFKFLKKQPKWKEEAEKYYIQIMYSMCLRTFEFRNEFICFDVFLECGVFSPQKVLKYCENGQMVSRILNNAKISERYLLDTEKTLREYLEDSRYVLALPFSMCLSKKFSKEKQEILEDIYDLENKTLDYYFNKYDLENVDSYQKIFHM